jgi:hypothetical protein
MMRISKCPEALWHKVCQADKTCTFFQTPDWHRIAAAYYGARCHPFLFKWSSAKAVLPLLHTRKVLFDYYSSPFGTYTDLISENSLSQQQQLQVKLFFLKKNIDLFSSPFSISSLSLPDFQERETHVVDLGKISEEKIFKKWKKGHKDNLRMGLKKGVNVRLAESRNDLKKYYKLYQILCSHWGKHASVTYPFSLYEMIWDTIISKQKGLLWMAEWKGELISAVIAFYHNKYAVAWNSAANPDHSKLYANQVIYHAIIADAKRRGYKIFDFNPSHGLEGVIKFKEGFGTEKLDFRSYRHYTPLYKIASRVKNSFAGIKN